MKIEYQMKYSELARKQIYKKSGMSSEIINMQIRQKLKDN